MPQYSERAKRNMTAQMQSQLDFFQQNLLKKQKRLAYNKKYFGRLPGFGWTIQRQNQGITKVKKDITNLKNQIIKLQKDGKINVIIDV